MFIVYAVNNTIQHRIAHGEMNYVLNARAAMVTSIIGVFLSVIGLMFYSYMKGGEDYIQNLSQSFLFGGNPSINVYCISLFFEGVASSAMVTMFLMLYYNNKFAAD